MKFEVFLKTIVRFGVTFLSVFYLLTLVFLILRSHINNITYWLWASPILLILTLDSVFLIISLFFRPKKTDMRFTTVAICLLCFFAFLISSIIVSHSSLIANSYIKYIGIFLNLLTYPLVIASLISLNNKFTILPEAHSLVSHGIYKYLRHPLYFSYILSLISNLFLFKGVFVILVNVILILLFIIRAKIEEKLLTEYIDGYEDYKNRTPFFPGIKWL